MNNSSLTPQYLEWLEYLKWFENEFDRKFKQELVEPILTQIDNILSHDNSVSLSKKLQKVKKAPKSQKKEARLLFQENYKEQREWVYNLFKDIRWYINEADLSINWELGITKESIKLFQNILTEFHNEISQLDTLSKKKLLQWINKYIFDKWNLTRLDLQDLSAFLLLFETRNIRGGMNESNIEYEIEWWVIIFYIEDETEYYKINGYTIEEIEQGAIKRTYWSFVTWGCLPHITIRWVPWDKNSEITKKHELQHYYNSILFNNQDGFLSEKEKIVTRVFDEALATLTHINNLSNIKDKIFNVYLEGYLDNLSLDARLKWIESIKNEIDSTLLTLTQLIKKWLDVEFISTTHYKQWKHLLKYYTVENFHQENADWLKFSVQRTFNNWVVHYWNMIDGMFELSVIRCGDYIEEWTFLNYSLIEGEKWIHGSQDYESGNFKHWNLSQWKKIIDWTRYEWVFEDNCILNGYYNNRPVTDGQFLIGGWIYHLLLNIKKEKFCDDNNNRTDVYLYPEEGYAIHNKITQKQIILKREDGKNDPVIEYVNNRGIVGVSKEHNKLSISISGPIESNFSWVRINENKIIEQWDFVNWLLVWEWRIYSQKYEQYYVDWEFKNWMLIKWKKWYKNRDTEEWIFHDGKLVSWKRREFDTGVNEKEKWDLYEWDFIDWFLVHGQITYADNIKLWKNKNLLRCQRIHIEKWSFTKNILWLPVLIDWERTYFDWSKEIWKFNNQWYLVEWHRIDGTYEKIWKFDNYWKLVEWEVKYEDESTKWIFEDGDLINGTVFRKSNSIVYETVIQEWIITQITITLQNNAKVISYLPDFSEERITIRWDDGEEYTWYIVSWKNIIERPSQEAIELEQFFTDMDEIFFEITGENDGQLYWKAL